MYENLFFSHIKHVQAHIHIHTHHKHNGYVCKLSSHTRSKAEGEQEKKRKKAVLWSKQSTSHRTHKAKLMRTVTEPTASLALTHSHTQGWTQARQHSVPPGDAPQTLSHFSADESSVLTA